MSKLGNRLRREWLELTAAADYLSRSYDEAVSEVDILQASLEGDLNLSLYLRNSIRAVPGVVVPATGRWMPDGQVAWNGRPIHDTSRTREVKGEGDPSQALRITQVMQFDGSECLLSSGTYDLSMWGDERFDIQDLVDEKLGRTPIFRGARSGVVLHAQTAGSILRLIDPQSPDRPAFEIPAEANVVVRMMELDRFSSQKDSRRSLAGATKARNTLLKIVFGLAKRHYSFDPSAQRSEASKRMSDALRIEGVPVSDETILKTLKEAAGVVEVDSSD